MRINIEIDDKLMRQALRVRGARTKRGVVEDALRLLVSRKGQVGLRRLRGRIRWSGDLTRAGQT